MQLFCGASPGRGLFLVRGMEVEIDPAKGALVVGLAEDDGDLAVEGDTVAEVGAAGFVGFDGLVHEGGEGFLEAFRCFFEAHNELVVGPDGLIHLLLEGINSHEVTLRGNVPE